MALSYYDILGVAEDAQNVEIRRAYRRVVKEYHPDLHPDDEKAARRSRELNLALETLLDPKKRERYDRLLDRRRKRASQETPADRARSAEKKANEKPTASDAKEETTQARPQDFSFPFADSNRSEDTRSSAEQERGWTDLPPFEKEPYVEPPAMDDFDIPLQGEAASQGGKPFTPPKPQSAYRATRRPRKATNHSLWLGVGLGVTGAIGLVIVIMVVGIGFWWFSKNNTSTQPFARGPASRTPRGRGEFPPGFRSGPANEPTLPSRPSVMRKNPVAKSLLESIPMPNGSRAIDFTTADGKPISAPMGIQMLQFPGVNTTRAFEFRLKVKRMEGEGKLVIGTPIMGQTVAVTLDASEGRGYVTGIDHVRQRGMPATQFHIMGQGLLCPKGRETEILIQAAMLGPMREIKLRVGGRDLGTFQYRPTDLQPQGEIFDSASSGVYIATQDAQFSIEAFEYTR